ncbi:MULTISPECIES: DUF6111 family protein [Methylorubrum]|uniref:Uncharacterized protein n=1 Tax=Methylorubrum suomiense TaxID=144191 RepID=A0ABQ4UNL9_9HYPH|nr:MULTISPECIES: DUF6111 family protein [Methylobacteriaceae]GJE73921.1 hypothetical protein BGCPKDLD_0488 [Methylorubrum suomiense]
MLRLVLEQVALFSLPFVLFAGWLLLARRSPLDGAEWRPQWTRLVLAGLFVVVASLLMAGLTGERHAEGYVPPRYENGRLVPGHFQ